MTEIKSIESLLGMNLNIPNYQRPYKWSINSINTLLEDISNAITDSEKYHNDFKYRIGTIILHKQNIDASEGDNIVDGQQRIISLAMIRLCIDESFSCRILEKASFNSEESKANIYNNYNYIKEWISIKGDKVREDFIKAFKDTLEVVVIEVNEESEAFQLFDSQNTRGKALAPHDLLKAYHLRVMKNQYDMKKVVERWEIKKSEEIKELFADFLFPILNWSRGYKSNTFTSKDIDTYKGISEYSEYTYAKRANKSTPYFQITEPFISGNDFFDMTDHYLRLLNNIKEEIETNTNSDINKIEKIISNKAYRGSAGFKHVCNLFFCALLSYYDRFHNFDIVAIKKMFIWAFMLRVDLRSLGYDSINKYAIGDGNNSTYTNIIPMFKIICYARSHNEISSIQIRIETDKKRNQDTSKDESKNKNWKTLYDELNNLQNAESNK